VEKKHPWNDHWIPRDGLLPPLACLKDDPPTHVLEFIEPVMEGRQAAGVYAANRCRVDLADTIEQQTTDRFLVMALRPEGDLLGKICISDAG
jgi:hypothetical protein